MPDTNENSAVSSEQPLFIAENPLTDAEIRGITVAVQSAFLKLQNLYAAVKPVFESYGFRAPSAGVIARDLSEKIETSIIQHCPSFTKGSGHSDLSRNAQRWEVKVCKTSGLTINQSATVRGENYIVINYGKQNEILKIWVLWAAQDAHFSPRLPNSNARALLITKARAHIQELFKHGTPSLPLTVQPPARMVGQPSRKAVDGPSAKSRKAQS